MSLEKLLRENNPCCKKTECEKGDYQEITAGNTSIIICNGCMEQGETFGHPMVTPKGFVPFSME